MNDNLGKAAREQLTLIRIYEELRALGYEGGYDGDPALRRRTGRRREDRRRRRAYVPLLLETVFVGKDRQYNRRFLQMCSHYLVQPVACTPASGWEKGQVENQVGLVRERFFTPRLRFRSYEELNAWLLDKCVAYAKAHRHVDQPERTIWEVFEEERCKLVEYRGPFDEFHTVPASVSKTCTVRFDNNKYSVLSTVSRRRPL